MTMTAPVAQFQHVTATIKGIATVEDKRGEGWPDTQFEIKLRDMSPGNWCSDRFPFTTVNCPLALVSGDANAYVGQQMRFTLERKGPRKYGAKAKDGKAGQPKPPQYLDSHYWDVVGFGVHKDIDKTDSGAMPPPRQPADDEGPRSQESRFDELGSAPSPTSEHPRRPDEWAGRDPQVRSDQTGTPSANGSAPSEPQGAPPEIDTFEMGFARLFDLGNYENERIEVKAHFIGADPVDALNQLKAMVFAARAGQRRVNEKIETAIPDGLTQEGFVKLMEDKHISKEHIDQLFGMTVPAWIAQEPGRTLKDAAVAAIKEIGA